jgi:hypothetical protein
MWKSHEGPALEACTVISKKTVTYFESSLGTAPFPRILKDPRLDARVDKFYASAMTRLSKVADKDFLKYIEHKMAAARQPGFGDSCPRTILTWWRRPKRAKTAWAGGGCCRRRR